MGWRNIWRNRRRSLVVISSIGFGIFAMILSMGIMNGFNVQMVENTIGTSLGHVAIHRKGWQDEMKLALHFIPAGALLLRPEGESPRCGLRAARQDRGHRALQRDLPAGAGGGDRSRDGTERIPDVRLHAEGRRQPLSRARGPRGHPHLAVPRREAGTPRRRQDRADGAGQETASSRAWASGSRDSTGRPSTLSTSSSSSCRSESSRKLRAWATASRRSPCAWGTAAMSIR